MNFPLYPDSDKCSCHSSNDNNETRKSLDDYTKDSLNITYFTNPDKINKKYIPTNNTNYINLQISDKIV